METEPKPTEPTPTEPEPTVPEDTEPVTPEKPVTRVEVKDGGFTHVPEKLKEVGLDTVEKVKEAIIQAMVKQNQHIEEENVAHYDVQLQYTEDGGKTWIKADESHFPKDGKLTVTIPYPAGTDSSYTFTVVHMFTSSAFGKTPGDVELPEVTNTEEGIQFEVTGLSPISVGWVAPVSADALQNEDTPDVTTYFIIMLAAVVCLVVVMIASHKRKRASK